MGAAAAEGSAHAVGEAAGTPSLLRRQGSGSAHGSARHGGAQVVHTITCRDLSLAALRAAGEGSTVACEEFTALNSVWRVRVKPNETRVGDAKGNNYKQLEVLLELVTPECTVPLDAFSAQVYGLGPKARSVQDSGLTFSTKAPLPPGAVAATTLCSVWRDSLWHIAEEEEGAVLPGGCLTVGIQLRAAALTWGPAAGAVAALRPRADPTQSLGAQLARLLVAGGEGAVAPDVTFTFAGPHAGAPPQRAHSFLLSLRSSVLRSQFRFPGQDAANGPPFAVTAPEEVTPAAMALLLRYIYTDGVDGVDGVVAGPDAAQVLTELLIAANYYDIAGLLSLCDELVEGALCAGNVLGALQLAHALCRERLCAGALRCAAAHVDELLDTREWTQLPAALQNAVVRTVRNHGEPASIRDSPPASRSRSTEDLAAQDGSKRA